MECRVRVLFSAVPLEPCRGHRAAQDLQKGESSAERKSWLPGVESQYNITQLLQVAENLGAKESKKVNLLQFCCNWVNTVWHGKSKKPLRLGPEEKVGKQEPIIWKKMSGGKTSECLPFPPYLPTLPLAPGRGRAAEAGLPAFILPTHLVMGQAHLLLGQQHLIAFLDRQGQIPVKELNRALQGKN